MEVEKTKENADNLEKQYLQAAEDRDTALTELEEVKRRNAELEKKLEQAMSVSDHYNYGAAVKILQTENNKCCFTISILYCNNFTFTKVFKTKCL